jgi:hypothetical protein
LSIRDIDFPTFGESPHDHHYVGHTHFWERALLSRRRFMTAAAATTGVVLGSGLWMPGLAQAWEDAKQRIHLHDNQKKFDAQLIVDTATMGWSAHTKDFKFESDPANTSTTIFAAIGRERNGVFFS